MRITTVWVVKDATPDSVLEDVLFKLSLDRNLVNYIMGSPSGAWTKEHHTVYTTLEDAREDAKARLEKAQKSGNGKRRAQPSKHSAPRKLTHKAKPRKRTTRVGRLAAKLRSLGL